MEKLEQDSGELPEGMQTLQASRQYNSRVWATIDAFRAYDNLHDPCYIQRVYTYHRDIFEIRGIKWTLEGVTPKREWLIKVTSVTVTSVSLKKAGMASRNIVMKKQCTLFWIDFAVVFGLVVLDESCMS